MSTRQFDTPAERVTLTGVAWPASAPAAQQQAWPQQWPKVLRRWNLAGMAAAAGAVEREIRLPADSVGVLRAATLAWDYSPGTHWSYTVQWLLLGTAVVVGYVAIGKRRGRQARGGER